MLKILYIQYLQNLKHIASNLKLKKNSSLTRLSPLIHEFLNYLSAKNTLLMLILTKTILNYCLKNCRKSKKLFHFEFDSICQTKKISF